MITYNDSFIDAVNCTCGNITSIPSCNITNCQKSDGNEGLGAGTGEFVLFRPTEIIFLNLSCAILMCIGILGNTLTCYVIINRKSMRRAIHLYTFNLAVTDLLILIFYIPSQMVMYQNQLEWVLGEEMCKINYVILPVALHSSIGTLLAITIDRFRGLVTPFSWRADSQRKAKIIIPVTWVVSLLLSLPLFIYPKVITYGTKEYCYEGWPSVKAMHWFWVSNFTIVFAIPLVVICTTQVVMVIVVVREIDNQKQNRRMITMVIALVVVFTVCTGFQHVFFFIDQFGNMRGITIRTKAMLFSVANLVVSLQAALNPVIYGTLRNDFQKAFLRAFVMLLIKLKLHKDVLNDRDKTSFTSKVLTRHFSQRHKRSPNKEYMQVSEMFQKKIELENTSIANAYYSVCDSPQVNKNFLYVPPSPGSSDGEMYFDSPRVSNRFALSRNFNKKLTLPAKMSPLSIEGSCDTVKLLSYKENQRKSAVHATLYQNLYEKYSNNICSVSDTGYHSAEENDDDESGLPMEESVDNDVFYNNDNDREASIGEFVERTLHRPSMINHFKTSEETTL